MSTDYWQYAFVGYVNSDSFQKGFKAGKKILDKRESELDDAEIKEYREKLNKEQSGEKVWV